MGKPNYIYLGPSIPVIGLKKNALYRTDVLPGPLARIAESRPVVRALYVSTKDLAEVKKKITKKGSLEYTANQELLSLAKKENVSLSGT